MVGENRIGERIISLALLSTHELKGHYRYRDRFQLLPAPPGTPKPPSVMGHYGLLLELAIDPLTYPDRDRDYWAHDVRERSRVLELERKSAARGITPPDGWWREEATSRRMTRTPAIVQELTRPQPTSRTRWQGARCRLSRDPMSSRRPANQKCHCSISERRCSRSPRKPEFTRPESGLTILGRPQSVLRLSLARVPLNI